MNLITLINEEDERTSQEKKKKFKDVGIAALVVEETFCNFT